jgi:hypothetical protein
MPTYYSIGDYRPTLGPNQQFGMVAFSFDEFTQSIAKLAGVANALPIIQEELRDFGQYTVAPIFRSYAPFKEGGSEEGEYEWADRYKHLRDSIRAEMRGAELILRMRKHGVYSVKGNGEGRIYPAKGKVLRIELPGGEVIYRRWVNAYKPPDPDWAEEAWQYIKNNNYHRVPMERIAYRILATLFQGKMPGSLPDRTVYREQYKASKRGGRPSRSGAEQRAHLRKQTKERQEVVKSGLHQSLHKQRMNRYYYKARSAARSYEQGGSIEHKRRYKYYVSLLRYEHSRYGQHRT